MHQARFKGKLKINLPQDEDKNQTTDAITWGGGGGNRPLTTQDRSLRACF